MKIDADGVDLIVITHPSFKGGELRIRIDEKVQVGAVDLYGLAIWDASMSTHCFHTDENESFEELLLEATKPSKWKK